MACVVLTSGASEGRVGSHSLWGLWFSLLCFVGCGDSGILWIRHRWCGLYPIHLLPQGDLDRALVESIHTVMQPVER